MENLEYSNLFDPNKKAEAFDKLALMFFNKNFGSTSKAEVELQMFSIYMDAMIDQYKNSDGTIDYNKCSDYEMGLALGVPQEKIRTLKIKKQARYPQDFKWQDSLNSIKNNIRLDKDKKKIMIPVRDPNLYNEIRNFIENNGGYIEIQRGNNLIQIRLEYFFLLMYEDCSDCEKKKIKKELVKKLKNLNKSEEINDAENKMELTKQVLSLTEQGLSTLGTICETLNPETKLASIFIDLIKKYIKQ